MLFPLIHMLCKTTPTEIKQSLTLPKCLQDGITEAAAAIGVGLVAATTVGLGEHTALVLDEITTNL